MIFRFISEVILHQHLINLIKLNDAGSLGKTFHWLSSVFYRETSSKYFPPVCDYNMVTAGGVSGVKRKHSNIPIG